METMEQKIEKFKQEQAHKLSKYEGELKLAESLGLSDNDAYFHTSELFGIDASVHFKNKYSLAEAVSLLERMEAMGDYVEMMEVREMGLSYRTLAHVESLDKWPAKTETILPFRFELSTFGDTLTYWLKLKNSGLVVAFKVTLHSASPFHSVQLIHGGKTSMSKVVDSRLISSDKAYSYNDDEGESLGHKMATKLWSSEGASQHFYITYKQLWDFKDMPHFSIKFLNHWF